MTYIALLRGINVGGQKAIKMTDLKAHFVKWGYSAVETYIQSGNVIFNAIEANKQEIASTIYQNLLDTYGFEVQVIVKRPSDLISTVKHNPFIHEQEKDINRMYFTFLSHVPDRESSGKLAEYDYSPEEYVLHEDVIYFYSPAGYGKARMNNNFFEKKLKAVATTRNLKTINKLIDIAKGSNASGH